jgi:natural product biosynthesis luciferase-like monooxygenase protein
MAGSVVLPLHDALRVAEEWAVVDNLSGGRAGISFASGWNPGDFVLNPERYRDRQQALFDGIERVRRLWRGESVEAIGGDGKTVRVRTRPTPVQRELPLWVTAASSPTTFQRAGEIGANVLTHLLDHDTEELAGKIRLYREARERAGHDPVAGEVTVMLHSFLGEDALEVRERARVPYCRYIKDNIHLLKGLAVARGSRADIASLSGEDIDGFVAFLYERFVSTRALLGSVESCRPLVRELAAVGVSEIACLLDFGPPTDDVLKSLPYLARLFADDGEPGEATLRAPAVEIRPSSNPCLDALYRVAWHETASSPTLAPPGRVLVFEDGAGVGASLAAQIAAAGAECRRIAPGEEPADLGCLLGETWQSIVDLRHLDVTEATMAADLELARPLRLVKALAARDHSKEPARLWLVSCAGQLGESARPVQSALWGLGKLIPIEQPRIWGGLVDLDPAATVEQSAQSLLAAMRDEVREDQIALRSGKRLGARLERMPGALQSETWSCRADAAYLVTGGCSGLGLATARWLANKGARTLLLAGRRAPSSEAREVVQELEHQGVTVEWRAVDVSASGALAAWMGERRAQGRPAVVGVVHAAGVWQDRPLAHLEQEDLIAVLAPKVWGTRALETCFPPGTLELFVAFSAFSSLLPAEGQANYAAANIFLDAATLRRRAAGERAFTVNWGPWSEIGFAQTEYGRRAHERLGSLGVSRITPEQGFDLLDRVIGGGHGQLGVMPIEWRRLFRNDPNARLSPLLSVQARLAGDGASEAGAVRFAESLGGLAVAEQIARVEAKLLAMVAGVVRLDPAEVPRGARFSDLGVDSLMAVEIKNRIQESTGVSIPLVKLLEGPSVASLAALLLAGFKVSELSAPSSRPASENLEEIEI